MKSVFFNEIDNLLKSFNPNKIVFWVGAGIDADAPTCLPIGNQLTEYVLELSCGIEGANKIKEYWKDLSELIQRLFNDEISISSIPRLETIFEAIKDFEGHLKNRVSIIDGLKSFIYAPPNQIHFILAYLLHQGANIVTTNYDSAIKNAYEYLFGNDGFQMKLENHEDRIFCYTSNQKKAGKIYYIHGIAQKIDSIGAMLSSVKNSFSDYFINILEKWFDNDSCFLFLGYGGVDAFDVNPFFKNHPRINNSSAVYIRHSFEKNTKIHCDSRPNEDVLLLPFENKYLLCYNTLEFLRAVIRNEIQCTKTKAFEWKEEFQNYCQDYSCDLQTICQLVVCDYLGVCINSIQDDNWYQKFLHNNRYSSLVDNCSYIGLYGLKSAKRIDNKKAIEEFSRIYPNNNLGKSDVRSAKKSIRSGFIEWTKIGRFMERQLDFQISNNNPIGWDTSTPLNRTVEVVFAFWACRLFDKKTFRKMLLFFFRRTMRMMKKTIESGYMYVEQINQINSNLIRLAFYESYFKNNYSVFIDYITKGLKEYAEVSSIDGIIDAIIFRILGNLASYVYNSEIDLSEDIRRDWDILIELLANYNSANYYNRLKYIKRISKRYRIILD